MYFVTTCLRFRAVWGMFRRAKGTAPGRSDDNLMSDATNVLDFLREQFARVHTRFDRIDADVGNLKVRMSGIEAETGYIRISLAELNGRVDRMDVRLDRIERRLDLVDSPAGEA
jgi:hypothetical protein